MKLRLFSKLNRIKITDKQVARSFIAVTTQLMGRESNVNCHLTSGVVVLCARVIIADIDELVNYSHAVYSSAPVLYF